jgi:hypothetical protein
MLRPILWSLALGDVIDSAVAVAIGPTPVTEKPHPTIVQRDNKIKTITLGDVSHYLTYKVSTLRLEQNRHLTNRLRAATKLKNEMSSFTLRASSRNFPRRVCT